MKRWVLLLLCLALLCAGCGKETNREDFRFTYREADIGINAEAGPVLYRLGEPVQCTQSPSCAFEGMDTTYYHGGIYLTTATVEGTERIIRAWFADDTVCTGEGLKIGDSRDRAEELYGSMQLRGFRGEYHYARLDGLKWKDWVFGAVCLGLFAAARWVNIPALLGSLFVR